MKPSLTSQEQHNLTVIQGLNQRGGRMLSVIDLLDAGSLSLEVAAYLLQRVSRGASFLTAAKPGGAGKTAVMGALLALTPPGAVLREVTSRHELDNWHHNGEGPTWHVCHELGAGKIPGYFWGSEIPAYFGLQDESSYLASNLHADTLPEVQQALCSPPNDVNPEILRQIELLLTLVVKPHQGKLRHRINTVYTAGPQGHEVVCQWDERSDRYVTTEVLPGATQLRKEMDFLAEMQARGVRELLAFRENLLDWFTL